MLNVHNGKTKTPINARLWKAEIFMFCKANHLSYAASIYKLYIGEYVPLPIGKYPDICVHQLPATRLCCLGGKKM